MTTIAVRDGIVAADRLITGNGSVLGMKTKIEKAGRAVIAATGTSSMCEAFLSWARSGCKGSPPPMFKKIEDDDTYDCTGIIILPNRILRLDRKRVV